MWNHNNISSVLAGLPLYTRGYACAEEVRMDAVMNAVLAEWGTARAPGCQKMSETRKRGKRIIIIEVVARHIGEARDKPA